ncbi:hypothetical protein [Nitrospira sp. Kam-Ns4a]
MLLLAAALLGGCVNWYSGFAKAFPVTEAFRTHFATKTVDESLTYVVWVDHEWVRDVVVKWLKERGHTVVEGVRLEKILEENKLKLSNTPDDEKRIMVAAKMAGAQQVLFGSSTISTEFEARRVITEHGGLGQKPTYYYVTVHLRSFDLETGNLAWRSTARYSGPVGYPVASLVTLAVWALARGMCPTEAGFTWTDPKDVDDRAGCVRKQG